MWKGPVIGGNTAVSCGRESQRTEHGGHLGGSQQAEWDKALVSWFPASSTVGIVFYCLFSPNCANRDCYFHFLQLIISGEGSSLHWIGSWIPFVLEICESVKPIKKPFLTSLGVLTSCRELWMHSSVWVRAVEL